MTLQDTQISKLIRDNGPGHKHYEIYGGTKMPDQNGWTYHSCHACPYRWRSKIVTEEVVSEAK